MARVSSVDVPSVEDRIEDLRRRSALLFLALNAFADQDQSGNYGALTREGFRGFAEIAQSVNWDVLAVAAALQSNAPKPVTAHGSPFVWDAPDPEENDGDRR